MKGCEKCSSSGIYVGINCISENCKYCNGKGYIDEDELITVPRKYIKDNYFE